MTDGTLVWHSSESVRVIYDLGARMYVVCRPGPDQVQSRLLSVFYTTGSRQPLKTGMGVTLIWPGSESVP